MKKALALVIFSIFALLPGRARAEEVASDSLVSATAMIDTDGEEVFDAAPPLDADGASFDVEENDGVHGLDLGTHELDGRVSLVMKQEQMRPRLRAPVELGRSRRDIDPAYIVPRYVVLNMGNGLYCFVRSKSQLESSPSWRGGDPGKWRDACVNALTLLGGAAFVLPGELAAFIVTGGTLAGPFAVGLATVGGLVGHEIGAVVCPEAKPRERPISDAIPRPSTWWTGCPCTDPGCGCGHDCGCGCGAGASCGCGCSGCGGST